MSNHDFWNFLMHWGYLAVFIAVFIEGEVFLIMIGIATSAAVFNYPYVIVAAALGAIVHDNTLFNISKFTGKKIIDNKPSLSVRVHKSFRLLDKYDYWAILAIRFLYGLRTVTLFVVGLSEIKRIKFFVFDAISSFVWAFIYITLGYFSGHAIMDVLEDLHIKERILEHKSLTIIICIVFPITMFIIYKFLKRLKKYE